MRRREFITLLGGAVTAWPLAARAQQIAIPVIGFLAGPSAGESRSTLAGFRNGLRQAGYVEGQNVHIAFRWAEGRYDRFPELASLPVAVIAAISAPAALAAISATKTIPVVFASSADPVRLGIVASLNRPGGNATGVAFLQSELVGKYFELLREMLPKAAVTGLLVNPTSANAETQLAAVPAATQALGLRIVVQKASNDRELDTSFATFSHQGVGALVVASDPFFYGRREQLVSLAARYALPTIHNDREYVAEGGLISYGASTTDAYRQVGVFTGWILKGNKPADLPVQQVTKLELVINLKTAKAIGLDVPPTLLARADEVWLKFKKSSGVSEDRRGVVEVASAAII
jgi:putative ABC transport system substrate-binding protein